MQRRAFLTPTCRQPYCLRAPPKCTTPKIPKPLQSRRSITTSLCQDLCVAVFLGRGAVSQDCTSGSCAAFQ